VAGEDARAAIEQDDSIFDVDVIDPIPKAADEVDGTDTLPVQVR